LRLPQRDIVSQMTKPWLSLNERREAAKPPPLGPLIAGARARGVADGFAWLGLAAILIDDRGEALHVNSGAVELMGEALFLEGGRLRARDRVADLGLNEAIGDALALGVARNVRLDDAQGEMWVHVAPMPSEPDDHYQLLRAVALLSRAGRRRSARH
jgi:hypothetical protein